VKKQFNIANWVKRIVDGEAGLHEFEDTEMFEDANAGERDIRVATWTIRCLANPNCAGSGKVIDEILKERRGEA
jgi:hypothetical protein